MSAVTMTFLSKTVIAASAALAVSACSLPFSNPESLGGLVVSTVRDTATGAIGKKSAPKPNVEAAQQAMALLAQTGRSGYITTVPQSGRTTVMVAERTNGPYTTYRGTNDTSITMRDGIMTASRGLGLDLMAQAISVPESSLFSGSFPKEFAKVQRHLDGENLLESAEFLCVIERKGNERITVIDTERSTVRYEETCKNSRRAFLNRYWVGSGGTTVWQSQQAISSVSGHIIMQYIAPR